MGLPKLMLKMVNKYLKGLEKRCQSLVTIAYIKQVETPTQWAGFSKKLQKLIILDPGHIFFISNSG
jgi:hypothetical protein